MSDTLIKLTATALETVLPRVALPPGAQQSISGCDSTASALLALESSGFLMEAARLAAHAFPKREAVWWACMCAVHTAPPDLPAVDKAAREGAELWVRQQTDAVRRVAMEHARDGGFASPEAWAAVGAFWSGDSMAPVDQVAVPPPSHLAGTAVAGSVALAAVRGDVTRRDARLRNFLASARAIAAGGAGRLIAEAG